EAKDDCSSFTCPLCNKNFITQHQLTVHIRQHNTESRASDHSCSICGKALSSASSLDRHMLVHSGERPYRCSACGQTFTTNGNMHRHMKIHDKDPSSTMASSPTSPIKGHRRTSAKRKPSLEDKSNQGDQSPKEKVLEESPQDKRDPAQEEEMQCPLCFKTFICKYGLESHMETHPDTSLRCDVCCISFRTQCGLLRHNAVIHKQLPTDHAGRPFIQNNPSVPLGFSDLAFIDFSCHKFPHIAQVWCETNLRRCASKFHRFVCETCNKGFPLQSALDLHSVKHSLRDRTHENATPPSCQDMPPVAGQASFMELLGLQPISKVKLAPMQDEALQAVLHSIQVICVDTPTFTLPQEANGHHHPPLDPASFQGLSQNGAFNFLSLQPFILQPDGSVVVKPVCHEGGMELADIPQILKMASLAPGQITLPLLSKAPCSPMQSSCKQMPPLKPKPLVAPCTSTATSTQPSLMSTQQASPGHVSPNLPSPSSQLLKTHGESCSSSSSSSSSSSRETASEKTALEAHGLLDGPMPPDAGGCEIKQEVSEEVEALGGKKAARQAEYPCRCCDQVFAFSGVLEAHLRFHLGNSPYQCNICNYAAPDKATLIRHMRTHSGKRPYVCHICRYPFTIKANCERHQHKKHMKSAGKEIEKNIEHVSTSVTALDLLDSASPRDASCHHCREDLMSYQTLKIHLRTHSGCRLKHFECQRCGAAFLAERNCIHHLLKEHPEVREREIESHITTLPPTPNAAIPRASPLNQNRQISSTAPYSIKVEDKSLYALDPDQPLDFSRKGQGAAGIMEDLPTMNLEGLHSPQLSLYDCATEPIDLSIPRNPEKKLKKDATVMSPYRPASESLLPKPTSASIKELPPLASVTQIISSVSATPTLLKREAAPNSCSPASTEQGGLKAQETDSEPCREQQPMDGEVHNCSSDDFPQDDSQRKGEKQHTCSRERPVVVFTKSCGVDLKSSGELSIVERMLATTDANKFSPNLQANPVAPGKEAAEQSTTPCRDTCSHTQSNRERHLLHKHGVANRTLRQGGATPKAKTDEGSHGSTEGHPGDPGDAGKECTESAEQKSSHTQDSTQFTVEPPTDPSPADPATPTIEESTGGFISTLLDIHNKPSLSCILPSGEPPLVEVE
ncbi:hypothetical protein MATL_G00257780, partial [Megalops atlanticus]